MADKNAKNDLIQMNSNRIKPKLNDSNRTGEGLSFERYNFRMADISNLKINERANVERPNLRESLQQEMKFLLNFHQFQNSLIFGISIIFQIKNKI